VISAVLFDLDGTLLETEELKVGEHATMVGFSGQAVETVPLDEVVGRIRPLDPKMYAMAGVLSELPE
jgi:phosphoglycolate phosphatase-like HAD superfamily hydrolase